MISIGEILKYMESGKAFSCTVISFDEKRETGGKELIFPEAILVQASNKPKTKAGRELTNMEKKQEMIARKNPSHKKWYTRNIRILQDGHPTNIIKKIHPPLIIKFNDQTVTV